MRYISVDIETTGLESDWCQILEIGAVIDDWTTPVDDLPTFHCYVENGDIIGQPYALAMNSKILRAIAVGKDGNRSLLEAGEVVARFRWWLTKNSMSTERVTFAGKNFGSFDLQFLKGLPNWDLVLHRHRFIDPGTLYFNPTIDDYVPDTATCMKRAGIEGEVAHTAVEDAKIVIKLIRNAYRGMPI